MGRFDNGWFKFYRRAFFEDIGRNPYCLAVWSALLSMATYKETKIIWQGKQRALPPGSVVFGISELAEKWEISKSTIWRWLQYLASTERIRIDSGTRGTVVTICNWEQYQTLEEASETPSVHGPNTERTPRERRKNLSEEHKKEEGKKEGSAALPSEAAATPEQTACRAVWGAYSAAYKSRYGVEPIRNATINAQVKQLVRRLGHDDAPSVAAFYVGHNGRYYVEKLHPIGACLTDAEKLRTEWATGRRMSGGKAREIERIQDNRDTFAAAAEALKNRGRGNG